MALSKSEKERIVTEVKEVASNASTLVISDARGLKVSELSEIRTKANQSDQNVRGAVTLPNSLGKEVVVAVFADGDHASDASAAGADYVGMEDLSLIHI